MKNRKYFIRIIIFSIVLLFLVPYGKRIFYIKEKVKYSEYEDKVKFKGIYFADEKVIYKGIVSSEKMLYKNGERVFRGSLVYEGIKAEASGILINWYDGYEEKYNLKNIKEIKNSDITKMLREEKTSGLKIINNTQWYICISPENTIIEDIKKGSLYEVTIGEKNYSLEAYDKFKSNDQIFIILKCNEDIKASDLCRAFEGYLVKGKYKGFNIPNKAVVNIKEDTGIFIVENGYARFIKVKVIKKYEDFSIVIPLNGISEIKDGDILIYSILKINNGDKVQ